METSIVTLYMEGYLCQFLNGLLCRDGKNPIRVTAHSFLGQLLHSKLEQVPEDCIFKPVERKHSIKIELGRLGTSNRKHATYYYYLPKSKQIDIEKQVMNLFDELLFQYLEIVKEKTEAQTKLLIDEFCERYRIDFATYYETLKKKYYRRKESLSICVP